jgi:hypothetical protein
LKTALTQLLLALDRIQDEHGEVCDTVVRDVLRRVITEAFILPKASFVMPTAFGLFSADGNAKVGAALEHFLSCSEVQTTRATLTPEQRLAAFEDADVRTDKGNTYDCFFSHAGKI